LRGNILGIEGYWNKLVKEILDLLNGRVLGIVLFGSTIYLGYGRDIDLLVVLRGEVDIAEKMRLERLLAGRLNRITRRPLDIHVFDMEGIRENLFPGSFLSGLALGYKILYDEGGVEEAILGFLEELSKTKYRLHNRYGSWDLGFHASIILKSKRGAKRSKGISRAPVSL
jgi:predicted nucleotidyltransferase